MSFPKEIDEIKKIINQSLMILATAGILGVALAFLIGVSKIDLMLKIISVLVILVIQAAIFAFFIFKIKRVSTLNVNESAQVEAAGNNVSDETLNKLKALQEANILTDGTLGINDSFRFVCKRLEDVFSFSDAIIVLPETKEHLKVIQAQGNKATEFLNIKKILSRGIAGRALSSGQPEIDRRMELEKTILNERSFNDLRTAAAVPLLAQNGKVFGAMILYGEEFNGFDEGDFEALLLLSEVVSPIFKNAFNYEKSLENALSDPITMLPNERAFYLILENQLAESQRNRETRPLTVLAVDVETNINSGEVDNELHVREQSINIAAQILKAQLRDMDFVAHIGADEFAVILPTATAEIAGEVVRRITQAVERQTQESSSEERIVFNFGAATFYQDGETGHELYQMALMRKDQLKKGDKSVIWFAKK